MSPIRTTHLDPTWLSPKSFISLERRQTSQLYFGKGLVHEQISSNEIVVPNLVDCEQNDQLAMKFRQSSRCHICFVKVIEVYDEKLRLSVPSKTWVFPRRFFNRNSCHYHTRIESRKAIATDLSLGGCQLELEVPHENLREGACYDIMLNNNRLTGRLNGVEDTILRFQFAIDDSLNPGLLAMVYKLNKAQNKGRRFAGV